MLCYAFVMLYLKDSPLRGVQNVLVCVMLYQKDGPLRSSDYFFAKCFNIIFCRKYQMPRGEGGGE